MKRLLRKADFFAGFINYKNETMSIYINANAKEVLEILNESKYNSIRGVIYNDGTEYCWPGDVTHLNLNDYDLIDINGNPIEIDIYQFRFAYENGDWIFDGSRKYTMEQLIELIIKYSDKLNKYGDLNGNINFGYTKNQIDDSKKEYIRNELGIDIQSYTKCNGINELEKLYNILIGE